MSLGRSWCAVLSQPGSVLVVGGLDDDDDELNTTEFLSLLTMIFAAGPTMLTERAGSAALALPQDQSPRRALVMGGRVETGSLSTAEVLMAAA